MRLIQCPVTTESHVRTFAQHVMPFLLAAYCQRETHPWFLAPDGGAGKQLLSHLGRLRQYPSPITGGTDAWPVFAALLRGECGLDAINTEALAVPLGKG